MCILCVFYMCAAIGVIINDDDDDDDDIVNLVNFQRIIKILSLRIHVHICCFDRLQHEPFLLFSVVKQRITMYTIFSHIAESSAERVLVIGAVFTITYFLYRRLNDISSSDVLKLPPALPSLPIVGSLPFMPVKMQDLVAFCISPRNKLGKIFSLRLGPT